MALGASGLGFRVLGFRVWVSGLGFRVEGFGFRALRVKASRLRVWLRAAEQGIWKYPCSRSSLARRALHPGARFDRLLWVR